MRYKGSWKRQLRSTSTATALLESSLGCRSDTSIGLTCLQPFLSHQNALPLRPYFATRPCRRVRFLPCHARSQDPDKKRLPSLNCGPDRRIDRCVERLSGSTQVRKPQD